MITSYLSLILFLSIHISVLAGKVLIIMSDNRDLNNFSNYNSSYLTMAALINFNYAKHHHYDFLFIKQDTSDLVNSVWGKYKVSKLTYLWRKGLKMTICSHISMRSCDPITKISPGSFNSKLLQYRSSPWSKLLVLMELTKLFLYDRILYLDSDMVIHPLNFDWSIENKIKLWNTNNLARTGPKKIHHSAIVYFDDLVNSSLPCSGGLLVNPKSNKSLTILESWWNYNLPDFNFDHP